MHDVGDPGAAFVFIQVNGIWMQQAAAPGQGGERFGESVAVDGNTAVIGSPFYNGTAGNVQGSVTVFVRNGTNWAQQGPRLTANDANPGDQFGCSVAVSGDTAVVGAWQNNHSGADNPGAAYVFVRDQNGVWTQETKLIADDAATSDFFGLAVAISNDTVVVGSPFGHNPAGRTGSAYVYIKPPEPGGWDNKALTYQTAKLTASDGAAGDRFGISVAVDGNTVVVGSVSDDNAGGTDAGSAYVFEKPPEGWHNLDRLPMVTASDAAAGDAFGESVAISGDTVVIGAPNDDSVSGMGSAAGSAYVFVRTIAPDPPGWIEKAKLIASDAGGVDQFGSSVAVSGDTAIFGSPSAGGIGAAYVFDLLPIIVPGDLDGDHDVDATDESIFAAVLLGLNSNPVHQGRADVDCSDMHDGRDIRHFVELLLGG